MVEEPNRIVGLGEAGDVGAPVTLDSFAPNSWNRDRQNRVYLWTPGSTEPYQMTFGKSALEEGAVITGE
jgi:hypothetical protein